MPPRIVRTLEEQLIHEENVRQRRIEGQRRRRDAEQAARQRIVENNSNVELHGRQNNCNGELNGRSRIQESQTRRRRNEMADQNRDLIQNTVEDYLGAMNVACVDCGALHFADEKVANKGLSFNDCCSHGAANLQPLP